MRIAETATGSHGVRVNNSTLVIVEFIASSLAKDGTPAKVLYAYLQGCFIMNPRHLKFIRFKFDTEAETLEAHQARLIDLVKTLNE